MRVFVLYFENGAVVRAGCVDDDDGVLVEPLSTPEHADSEGYAAVARRWLCDHGYRRQPIIGLLDSQMCYPVSLPVENPAERNRRVLRFRVEEFVPIEAEKLAIDFVSFDAQVFACASEVEFSRRLLDALAAAGCCVTALSSVVLQAAAWVAESDDGPSVNVVAFRLPNCIETVWFDGGRPVRWNRTEVDVRAWARHVSVFQQSWAARVVIIGFSAEEREAIQRSQDLVVEAIDGDLHDLSAIQSAREVRSHRSPQVNLRRDGLALRGAVGDWERMLRPLGVAAILFFLLVGVAGWLRGNRYAAMRSELEAKKEHLYRETFPGRRVPRGIERQLKMELSRLGEPASIDSTAPETSALVTLMHVLSHLPDNIRFQVQELRVDGVQFELNGRVPQIGTASRIASSLREAGYQLTVPRDGQLFTVVGQREPVSRDRSRE